MYELRAPRGQRWNITLLDFAAAHAPDPSAVTGTGNGNAVDGDGPAWESAGAVCRRYAVIHEELDAMEAAQDSGYSDEMIICGGSGGRRRSVFLSQTEVIRLEVLTHPEADVDDQTDLFLLQFAGECDKWFFCYLSLFYLIKFQLRFGFFCVYFLRLCYLSGE